MSKQLENAESLILEVAKKIAKEEGISSISMRKIANECEIALGSIYNYYPTKMDIIFVILEEFWINCLVNFKEEKENDFYEEIERLYFHIYNELENFKSSFLRDLSTLSGKDKSAGKKKELEFKGKLIEFFLKILNNHEKEFNERAFNKFEKRRFVEFIVEEFLMMLKKPEDDYRFFDYVIRKILE
ncbi:MAG: TetR/AcrR family transcriptional regulator [Sarcina sp.]